MNNLITTNELTMSSREIAELLNKTHSNIKISAERMADKGTIALQGSKFIHSGNEYTEYLLNKRDSLILVAQNSPEFTAAIVDRWQELENNQPALPTTFAEALQLAADQAKEIEDKNRLIETQKPAVEFVANYTKAETGSKGFREVCKLLNVNERVFRNFLVDQKIMYMLGGSWTAHANHIKAGRFEVKTGETNGHVHNTVKFTGKGINWIVGLYAQHQISEK